jgi:hypothetical protein
MTQLESDLRSLGVFAHYEDEYGNIYAISPEDIHDGRTATEQ